MAACAQSVFEAVRRTICNVLEVGTDGVTGATVFGEFLPDIESGDLLTILYEVEKQFNLKDLLTPQEIQVLHDRRQWIQLPISMFVDRVHSRLVAVAA